MFQLPPTGRVITTINPQSQWGWSEVLANKANFLLETIIWQNSTPSDPKKKSEIAKHKREQPKPWIPDFMKEPHKPSPINDGSVALEVDEVQRILAQARGENTES